MRRLPAPVAASKVINTLVRGSDSLRDDTTIVVVELLPPGADLPGVRFGTEHDS